MKSKFLVPAGRILLLVSCLTVAPGCGKFGTDVLNRQRVRAADFALANSRAEINRLLKESGSPEEVPAESGQSMHGAGGDPLMPENSGQGSSAGNSKDSESREIPPAPPAPTSRDTNEQNAEQPKRPELPDPPQAPTNDPADVRSEVPKSQEDPAAPSESGGDVPKSQENPTTPPNFDPAEIQARIIAVIDAHADQIKQAVGDRAPQVIARLNEVLAKLESIDVASLPEMRKQMIQLHIAIIKELIKVLS